MNLDWIVVYGYAPEKFDDGTQESDDCNCFIGNEKQCDDFFQEMMFDGSYPILYKAHLVECAIKQGAVEEDEEGALS